MLFLQSDEGIEQIYGDAPYYQFSDGIKLHFDIRDFIQVNSALNEPMVNTALDWLELSQQDCVLDLFCGMGNFTLPLAKRVKSAVGIEGVLKWYKKRRKMPRETKSKILNFSKRILTNPLLNNLGLISRSIKFCLILHAVAQLSR